MVTLSTDALIFQTQIKDLGIFPKGIALVGSVYICGEGEDLDILFLVDNLEQVEALLKKDSSWTISENAFYALPGDFFSARKGTWNALFVSDVAYFKLWLAASRLCRVLKLTNKADRVAVHKIIMDGIDVPLTTLPSPPAGQPVEVNSSGNPTIQGNQPCPDFSTPPLTPTC